MKSSKFKVQSSKFRKGFTFVEVIIATFIFVVIMTAVTAVFGSAFKSYRTGKAIQKDLEGAQQAMNIMAKVLRTSSVENCSPPGPCTLTSLRAYDYSQGKCIVYQFASDNSLKFGSASSADKITCDFVNIIPSSMTTGTVTGNFYVTPSSAALAGKMTIAAKVCPATGCTGNPRDEAKIQSTVSLRNEYEELAP